MRKALLLVLLASCDATIGSGAYFCGTDSLCPDGFACDGVTNTCVNPSAVQPFACNPKLNPDPEPDNDASTAQVSAPVRCAPTAIEVDGCLLAGDPVDVWAFTVPAGCALPMATVKVEFETAFEEVGLSVDGSTATDEECDTPTNGRSARCITFPVTAGSTVDVSVAPTGSLDCGGDCGFNRYGLSISLGSQ